METAKNLLWCVIVSVVICSCTIGLLVLGAWLDASIQPEVRKEKIVTCEDGKRGFYNCKTEYY